MAGEELQSWAKLRPAKVVAAGKFARGDESGTHPVEAAKGRLAVSRAMRMLP